jgi:hypothetical protein
MIEIDSVLAEMEAMLQCDITRLDAAGVVAQAKRLRKLRGVIDRSDAALAARTTELYEAGTSATASDVITRNQNVSSAEAKRRERRGKVLDRAKGFADALANGTVTAEHADALANASTKLDETVAAEFFSREPELLAKATNETPERFARECRRIAAQVARDNGISRNNQQRRDTRISRKITTNGMYQLHAEFHPELGEAIWSAIDTRINLLAGQHSDDSDRSGGESPKDAQPDRAQLGAQALADLVVGGHQQTRPIESEIVLIADVVTAVSGELHEHSICETNHGVELPPASLHRLVCNGRITPIIVDTNGVVLNAGRSKRLANRAQRRALRTMYRTCAFSGCDTPFLRCEIHHIEPWEIGGNTDLINLLPLCSRHHHVVHELGWRLSLSPDRTLTITQPDGSVFATTCLERSGERAPVHDPSRHPRGAPPPDRTDLEDRLASASVTRLRRRPGELTEQLALPA